MVESGEGLTFEQAFTRLEEVVRQLEGGQQSLDRAIELYEEGMKLSQHCDAMLRHAQLRVSKLQSDMSASGQVGPGSAGAGDANPGGSGGSSGYGAGGSPFGNGPDSVDFDDDDQKNLPW